MVNSRALIKILGSAALTAGWIATYTSFPTYQQPPIDQDQNEEEYEGGIVKKFFIDEQGRHFIPHGFVTVTEDGVGPVYYTLKDYERMVRLGANFQVIRLRLGKLGGWPGYELQNDYLEQLDNMVNLGKKVGLKTCFKLTVYGIEGFRWDDLWCNKENQELLINAWKVIWERYKNESSVIAYDLINEPYRGSIESYEVCERDYLVPLYRRLIDEMHAISPDKYAFYQPLLRDKDDPNRPEDPFVEMKTPINRERIVYAPHIYEYNLERIKPTLDRYQREAALSNARICIGEWGPSTSREADTDLDEQHRFRKIYVATAKELDARGIGHVKAWFTGSRGWHSGNTWSIFRDDAAVGTVERKYIVDVIARPRPLVIAGRIERYGFNFATREFEMTFIPNSTLGPSEIYVPVNRHYPDGFQLVYITTNSKLTLAYDENSPTGFRVIERSGEVNPELFRWDAETLHIIVERWTGGEETATLKILPGYGRIKE